MAKPTSSNPPKLRPGHIVILAAAIGLTGYWGWTYTGIYRWLAELQLRFFHEYGVEITFVFSLIIVFVPLVFLSTALDRALAGRLGIAPRMSISHVKPPGSQDSASPRTNFRLPLSTGAVFALVGIGLTVAGAYQLHRGKSAGQMIHADVAEYESGHGPAGTYLSVKGFSDSDAAQGMKSDYSKTKYYIPLVSAGWRPGSPIGMFIETDTPNMMPTNYYERSQIGGDQLPEIWEGMIDPDGLPGAVRTQFENHQMTFAAGFRLLDVGQTPEHLIGQGRTMMRVGGWIAGLSILVGSIWTALLRLLPHRQKSVAAMPIDPRLQIKSVVNPNPQSRAMDIASLGISGDASATDALINSLKDRDPDVCRTALSALGNSRDPKAIYALANTFYSTDTDPGFRLISGSFLAQMGVPGLAYVILASRSQNAALRQIAGRIVEPLEADPTFTSNWNAACAEAEKLGHAPPVLELPSNLVAAAKPQLPIDRDPNQYGIVRIIIGMALMFFGFPLAAWGAIASLFLIAGVERGDPDSNGLAAFAFVLLAILGVAMVVVGLYLVVRGGIQQWKLIRSRRQDR